MMNSRPFRRLGIPLLALLVICCQALGQDIVAQIVAGVPSRPHSYAQMLTKLSALQRSDRVSIMRLGRSVGGREVLGVALHSPKTVFGQGKRLFVIGRQHGNEPSGTEAILALLRHFATSQAELERGTLERITIVAIPMANPDGAERSRRRNGNNVDLNRDWLSRSQPETRAIERAVRIWQPHALMDLHELPRNSSKPEYQENFVETIGEGRGIPRYVSVHSQSAAADMAAWLRLYRHRTNIYYDGPQKDRRLCHRHFGLDHGIPSFLMEAKTGSGRSLGRRVSFHVVGMLVVASYLMSCESPGPVPVTPVAPPPLVASTRQPEATPRPSGPATVCFRSGPREGDTVTGDTELEAVIGGGHQVRYVKYYLDGRLWLVSNMEPYRCQLDTTGLGDGGHEVRVDVIGSDGHLLAQARRLFGVDNSALAGR